MEEEGEEREDVDKVELRDAPRERRAVGRQQVDRLLLNLGLRI